MKYFFELEASELDTELYHFRVFDSEHNFIMSLYDTKLNIETEFRYWLNK